MVANGFVAIVSSNPSARARLARMIGLLPDTVVCYEAGDIGALSLGITPAIVVIDLTDKPGSQVDIVFWRRLPPGSRAIVLCRAADPPHLPTALRAGVRAIMNPEAVTADVLAAVEAVRRGSVYIVAELLDTLLHQSINPPAPQTSPLTKRELEALDLVSQGLSNAQVGEQMGLTELTVSTYVKRIRAKLNARNKAELARLALERGYIPYRSAS